MKPITVIGGSLADITGIPQAKLIPHDSNQGKILISDGGVARNISENLARLNMEVVLISAFGNDIYGERLHENCHLNGVNIEHSIISDIYETSV